MIPFLNVLWHGIDEQEGHRILVFALLFITMAPSVLNIFNFRSVDTLLRPWTSTKYIQIVPDWWTAIYPITYYYIGAYIKWYVDMKKYDPLKITAVLLGCVLAFGVFNIWRSYSVKFIKGIWCHGWGSAQNTVMSVLVFLLINSIDWKLDTCANTIRKLSGLTFAAYLLSWIPDNIFYPLLKEHVPDMVQRINYFPLIVPAVILTSLVLSYLAECIFSLFQKICSCINIKRKTVL